MRIVTLGLVLVLGMALAAQEAAVPRIDAAQLVTHQHLVTISVGAWRSAEDGGPWSRVYQLSNDGGLFGILLEQGQEPQRLKIDQAGYLQVRAFVLEQINLAALGDGPLRSDPRGATASAGLHFDGLQVIRSYDGRSIADIPAGLMQQVEYLDSLEREAF